MNINKKLIAFFVFFLISILLILNVKNPEKTKFYLFTYKTEEISLGNLINIAFISGFSLSSVLSLISKNNSQQSLNNNLTDYEKIDNSENDFSQESNSNRPPERDVRESQPTISVNYRFVDQDNYSYSSKNTSKSMNNPNNEDIDWVNHDNEW